MSTFIEQLKERAKKDIKTIVLAGLCKDYSCR